MFDTDKFARDTAAKGPEDIVHTVGEAVDYFPHLQMDDDFGGMVAGDGRGNQRRIRQDRGLLPRDLCACGWQPL
jgi:hypothetical protein